MFLPDFTFTVGVSKHPDGECAEEGGFGTSDAWMTSGSAVKKVEMGGWGSKEGDGGVFTVRKCRVPRDNRGQSNTGDSMESDPMCKGSVQCPGKETTDDEIVRPVLDGREEPGASAERLGFLKMTRSG